MNTYFDFITHVKGIEYLVAIASIVGFIVLWEVLKPKPFSKMVHSAKEDLSYMKESGSRQTLRNVGKLVGAPFIGLAYVISLPIAFVGALLFAAVNGLLNYVGQTTSFDWRPMEAYLGGKKRKKAKAAEKAQTPASEKSEQD